MKIVREEELALSHGQLMALLYALHGAVTAEQTSKIRSRFKSLQKAHMPAGERPGRGTRAKYCFRQVCEVVLAFEFAGYRVDANSIKLFYDVFQKAVVALESIALCILQEFEHLSISIHFKLDTLWSDVPAVGVYRSPVHKEENDTWPLPRRKAGAQVFLCCKLLQRICLKCTPMQRDSGSIMPSPSIHQFSTFFK